MGVGRSGVTEQPSNECRLIVEDELAISSHDLAEPIEVAAARAGTAVQAEKGAAAGTENAVGDPVAVFDLEAAFARKRCSAAACLSGLGHRRCHVPHPFLPLCLAILRAEAADAGLRWFPAVDVLVADRRRHRHR
jgi:hypothetical protein